MMQGSRAKRVHAIEPNFDHGLVKTMYYDRQTQWLYPDFCMVDLDGNLLWQTNALRLRGPDVETGAKIAVVWGDSVVFGVFARGWPEMLGDFSECIFLNGGIEGIDYVGVLNRAIDFNASHQVAVNVLMPGWHPVGANAGFRTDLRGALRQIPRAVLTTMPTSLNAAIIDTDLSYAIQGNAGDDVAYRFWEGNPYSIALQKELFTHICERNDMVREVARDTGTPLVDLYSALDSSRLEDFRENFFDISHPRPAAYPKVASIVWETVGPLLSDLKQTAD